MSNDHQMFTEEDKSLLGIKSEYYSQYDYF